MIAFWNGGVTLARDVRIGLRMIARVPLLACAVVLTLSLGIGAATGVFSLLNPIAFRPPVNDQPESFFSVKTTRHDFTVAEYHAFRDGTRSVQAMAAWASLDSAHLDSEDGPRVDGVMVSCNVFSVFSVKPSLGRLIEPADCQASEAVMVLNERVWRRAYDADPNIIGKAVLYSGRSVTIVGVLSPPFADNPNQTPLGEFSGAWVSMEPHFVEKVTDGGVSWLHLAGRLRPGYSRAAAEKELQILEPRIRPSPGEGILVEPGRATIMLTDGSNWESENRLRPVFLLVLALPTLLMVVASVNVATLLLSRAAGRQHEMAIRLAVGAGRLRLVRMLLVETTLLAGSAAAVSLMLAGWIPSMLVTYLFGGENAGGMPPREFFTLDWRVFVYLGVCTIGAALCAGVAPALESLNVRLSDSLQGRQFRPGPRSASRLRGLLIGVQVAFSMAPLVFVAMFVRAESRMVDPGFETHQVAWIEFRRDLKSGHTLSAVAKNLESLPTVQSVAYSWDIPGLPLNVVQVVPYKGATTSVRIPKTSVSSAYFQTVGIPILAGQSFQSPDIGKDDSRAVVVSQRLAQRLFPGIDPLGQFLDTDWGEMQIVGIARDVRTSDSEGLADGSLIYQRISDEDQHGLLMVRFEGELAAVAASVQAVARQATGAEAGVEDLATTIGKRFADLRRIEYLLGALGGLSLLMAVIGVFGVVSFNSSQRRKETAIRLAVGASRVDVVRTIIARGLRPIPAGLAAGVLLAWALLKVAASQRILPVAFNLLDPMPYLVVCLLLLIVTLASMLVSARRAVWSDAVSALREE